MSETQIHVIFDVDGTLVDNNYQHALAWHHAFREAGYDVPAWRAHRAVGIGSELYVAEVAGDDAERADGDRIRDRQSEIFAGMIEDVAPFPGAADLVRALRERGAKVVLASSGDGPDIEKLVGKLGIADDLDGWTTSDDVERSKPEADLIEAALEKLGGGPAVMVGDTPYDVEAARRAGVETVAVLSGGFPEADLRDAGAVAVYDSVAEILAGLEDSPLAGGSGPAT